MDNYSRLPLPDIRDEVEWQHSFKQDDSRLRPPKLKNRSHLFASNSTSAHAISFRGECGSGNITTEMDALLLGNHYDSLSNESYFEQCFTRLAKIGEGSFGEVFKVISKEDGNLYAVKMSKQLFRSGLYRQERLEEVRRYEQFSGHSNCVRFYRAWEQNDCLYMQMELCRESLERYLERHQQIPEKKIWCIFLDLLLALKSLHDLNLIHLDIKLDNVLIGDDDCCKLADFGLVVDVDKANSHQTTEGDSRYIAPEIMRGEFSKAADIFSLGIALLELACNLKLPSNGPLWQQLRNGILPEDFIKDISAELQTIIKQMMTPNPQSRPTVDQLLRHKKFVSMLQNRNRWDIFLKIQRTIRNSRRIVWTKMCNLKCMIFTFFACMLTNLKLTESIAAKSLKRNGTALQTNDKTPIVHTYIVSSTPTSRSIEDEPFFEISQQVTPSNFNADNIVNSTPVQLSSTPRWVFDKTLLRCEPVESGISSMPNLLDKPFGVKDMEENDRSVLRKRLFSSDSD